MKGFIVNRKFIPALNFIEQIFECTDLKYFDHSSNGLQRDVFWTVGEAVKQYDLKGVRSGSVFGLPVDKV